MTKRTIGVDISKSHLKVFDAERGDAKSSENTISGFRGFENWLGKLEITRVGYEPTRPYHRNLGECFCDKLTLLYLGFAMLSPSATLAEASDGAVYGV